MSEASCAAPAPPFYGVCLRVAYDGTGFSGFARQPGQRTIQGSLESAISAMAGAPTLVRGASRTDAGVHALGQVVAFDVARVIPERGWKLGLNRSLPDDLRIVTASPCAVGYEPRFDAAGKLYRYLLDVGDVAQPLRRNFAWHLGKRGPLSIEVTRRAARLLEGTHDYRAFRSADDERTNTVRTLSAIDVIADYAGERELVAIEVRGSAFMKNMVRILVGTLVEVGCGKRDVNTLAALLGPAAERRAAGVTAPAHGLTLVEVVVGRSGGSKDSA